DNAERGMYRQLGEMAFLDQKWQLFREAVADKPMDFIDRVATRFLAATVIYTPHTPEQEGRHPVRLWLRRVAYPLPFVCLLFLLISSVWRPLHPAQWIVIAAYACFLLPYILVSYYERYKIPVLAAEIALCAWALARAFRMVFVRAAPDEAHEVIEDEVID